MPKNIGVDASVVYPPYAPALSHYADQIKSVLIEMTPDGTVEKVVLGSLAGLVFLMSTKMCPKLVLQFSS